MPIEIVTASDDLAEGPCSWPVLLCEPDDNGDTDDCYASRLDDLDAATRTAVLRAAVTWVWQMSGRRYSLCSLTVRPCRKDCDPCSDSNVWRPERRDGQWFNVRDCGDSCLGGCSCEVKCEVNLPGPVHAVTEVLVDGRTLKPEEYRVDNRNRLVRIREPQLTPGALGVNYFFLGGNPASSPVEICDVSQTPDALAGWDPGPVGGCYTQAITSTNPDFDFNAASSVQFRVKRNLSDTVSFVVGEHDGTDQYQFPTATQLNAPGQSMESTVRSDGSWLRVTFVAGTGTIQRVGNPLVVGGDPTILLERFELALGGCWPTCQDLDAPSDVPPSESADSAGTWEVTFQKGIAVPEGGQLAAGILAGELAKACLQDAGCRLPSRVTSMTRQGVTMALLDPDVGNGGTGIFLIDSWVHSVMEPRRHSGAVFLDPGSMGQPRRTTWES